ncbi:MAG: HEAT repeat domain-containing protein [Deltaproteobacteria bacterium]|nr:HEAT repeat domain-containing protein [Deltaproteobacteria bacterium]
MGRLFWVLLVWAVVVLTGAQATAGESVASLAKKLRSGDDFRVRTQAALALGASASGAAVQPLCGGLDDSNDTVRAAAAAALGKLKKGGVDCLKKRLDKESSSNVKKMMSKAIRLIEEAASGPALSKSTRYYVKVGKTTDRSGRGGSEVSTIVRSTLRGTASKLGAYVFAPAGESSAQAKKRLRKHPQVDGYYFEPAISVSYTGTKLLVGFEMKIYGYPGKAPQGSLNSNAGYTGISSKDVGKENELIKQLVANAMGEFNKMAAQVD